GPSTSYSRSRTRAPPRWTGYTCPCFRPPAHRYRIASEHFASFGHCSLESSGTGCGAARDEFGSRGNPFVLGPVGVSGDCLGQRSGIGRGPRALAAFASGVSWGHRSGLALSVGIFSPPRPARAVDQPRYAVVAVRVALPRRSLSGWG